MHISALNVFLYCSNKIFAIAIIIGKLMSRLLGRSPSVYKLLQYVFIATIPQTCVKVD